MTKSTAKKGMIEYKSGFNKDQFDYDYLMNLPYNDKILVKHLIDKLNDADHDNNKLVTVLSEELGKSQQTITTMQNDIDGLNISVKEIEKKYIEIIKGLITR